MFRFYKVNSSSNIDVSGTGEPDSQVDTVADDNVSDDDKSVGAEGTGEDQSDDSEGVDTQDDEAEANTSGGGDSGCSVGGTIGQTSDTQVLLLLALIALVIGRSKRDRQA